MHPRHLAAAGLALVGLAQLQWGSLAFPSLPNLFLPLWLEALALGAAAWGVLRDAPRLAASGFGLAVTAQLAFFALFGAANLGADGALFTMLTTLGYALAAWSFARGGGLADAKAGFALAGASMVGSVAMDLAQGSTFLLLGYAMAVPGWLLAAWAALQPASAPARPAPA